MKLKEIRKLTVQIKLLTGLHIGGNKDIVEIGGIDSPVVKNPNTQIPYIPGSSIKGKMRFWMEWKTPGKIILDDQVFSADWTEATVIPGAAQRRPGIQELPRSAWI